MDGYIFIPLFCYYMFPVVALMLIDLYYQDQLEISYWKQCFLGIFIH
jgi:hypothetical protein